MEFKKKANETKKPAHSRARETPNIVARNELSTRPGEYEQRAREDRILQINTLLNRYLETPTFPYADISNCCLPRIVLA